MARFDPNTWYSIAYTSSNGESNLGVNPDPNHQLAVYLYPANITSTHQQFQILIAPSSTSRVPAYLFRGSNVPANFYLKTYCADLNDCAYKTWSGMHVIEDPEDVTQNLEWTLADSGAGDGSYHIMNQANGTSYFLDASGTTIWMNPDLESLGLRWTISSVCTIDNTRFSTTATPLATRMTSASATSPITTITSLNSVISSLVTPSSSVVSSPDSPSSGMSSSTKSAIGGVAGGFFLLLLLTAFAFFCLHRRKRRRLYLAITPQTTPYPDLDTRRAKEMYSEPSVRTEDARKNWSDRAEMHAGPNEWAGWIYRAEVGIEEVNRPIVELHSGQHRWPSEVPSHPVQNVETSRTLGG